ncbi:glutathione S-transferase family protein [Limibaculum sp. M0105]|uniref:glutathione transferase n=1 Tax=Thermohalobaculum xanthum TaxID=2753746 RepID=A0A8J7SFX5_9RHOB|nr:glutathione S-transferase family protein [Thermohalobaculum xanthum]MBK0400441.1 glutathione S-transferase family protein [Thermohalobaculum xanthum]
MTLTLVSHVLCPYVQRAAIALAEKGVPYRRIDIDLSDKPDWFRRISPLGKVPLLQVDDGTGPVALFESQVIAEYLEETRGALPLHPADPLERARHRAWIEVASATLAAIARFYGAPNDTALSREREALAALLARIGAELGDGPFFGGDRFTLVDAAWAPVFRYLDAFEAIGEADLTAPLPRLGAWRAALAGRPSVRGAVAADYPARLLDFLARRDSALGRRLRDAA